MMEIYRSTYFQVLYRSTYCGGREFTRVNVLEKGILQTYVFGDTLVLEKRSFTNYGSTCFGVREFTEVNVFENKSVFLQGRGSVYGNTCFGKERLYGSKYFGGGAGKHRVL